MDTREFHPLGDRVLVKRAEAKEMSEGGLYIPEKGKEPPEEGSVIAIGEGRITEDGDTVPMRVAVGDDILFAKYAGSNVTIGGYDYIVMREDDILGVLR